GGLNDRTAAIDVGHLSGRHPASLGEQSKTHEEGVVAHLSKIEAALKQKARTRHYVMLAFYIVSLFAIKFGDRYNYWVDFSTSKARASERVQQYVVPQPAAVQRSPALPQVAAAALRPAAQMIQPIAQQPMQPNAQMPRAVAQPAVRVAAARLPVP